MRRRACGLVLLFALSACAETPQLVGSGELARTRARVDALEHRDVESQLEIERLRKRIADLEAELRAARAESTPRDAEGRLAPAPMAPPIDVAKPGNAADAEIEESDLAAEHSDLAQPSTDAASAYEAALRALRDGNPADAEKQLRAFAARYPDSDLADNAWFWLGESLRVRGDLGGALDAYRTAIDRYPEGNKVPDALFKLGQVLEAEGRRDAAREAWAQLVRRYPSTAAAESARTLLSRP